MEKANATLTADQRRELVLRLLDGEGATALCREYGVARSRVYGLLHRALLQPETDLANAEAEAEFYRRVIEKQSEKAPPYP